MAGFKVRLSREACDRLYDALVCLAKFGEFVTIEAQQDQLALSALNASRSGYIRILLDRNLFCSEYEYYPGAGKEDCLAYRILNKVLLSVFKIKSNDSKRPNNIEECQISLIEHPEAAQSRFQVKFLCNGGIKKTFKLIYESVEPLHALFDKKRATNKWTTRARLLREFTEYFGARTEQLDMCFEEGRFILTSYTEKIMDGAETLKQPLQTAISIETLDFEAFDVIENLHVGINVKDFKNMVSHAETLETTVATVYSQPARPLQFSYGNFGMLCELTLMTIGDGRGLETPVVRTRTAARGSAPAFKRQVENTTAAEMLPPRQPVSRALSRPERPLGSRASKVQNFTAEDPDPDSLFIPAGDDNVNWEPVNFQDEESDLLGWDVGADNDLSFHSTFQDGNGRLSSFKTRREKVQDEGIAPTQRASQVKGLFD